MLRTIIILAMLFAFTACTNSSGKSIIPNTDTTLHTSASSKVLIELFTSQGCSSCPAADKLIGNLITADTNVIALSFHVDYWDRLGWKDVFSNHDYTLRQQEYVQKLHAESLYTPQAIVQGKYEMVGSNRARVMDAVNKVRAQDVAEIITAAATINGSNIDINYHVSAVPANEQLVIALVQNKAATAVIRGENAGNELNDYNVVRSLQMQPLAEEGKLQFALPGDLKKDNASIILFTQNVQTKEIATVTQLHL